jgi:uncharacterized membrane protein
MKNLGMCLILLGALVSCNVPKDNEEDAIPTSKLEVLTSISEEDTVKGTEEKTEVFTTNLREAKNQKPLVVARGSEPGWYAEFFADHLRLLVDYGADSLILDQDFSGINKDKTFSATIAENKEHKTSALSIALTDKPCTEEGSGEKSEKSISIKYNNKTYKGCATAK